MKKHILFVAGFLLLSSIAIGQTGHIEDFEDGDLTGWGGQADYELTNSSGELQIITHKTSTWNSFEYSFSAIDISSNPYVSMKVKTDIDFNLSFSVWDNLGANYAYPLGEAYQTIVHSDGYATYTFDFSSITGVDLTVIHKLNFVFNPNGTSGCNSTVYFDDIQIGDQALHMPAISKVEDQYHRINSPEVSVQFWGVKDRASGGASLAMTATSSNTGLIPDPVVTYIAGETEGTLVYTPVADQTGSATITIIVSGNAADDNVSTFNVTIEGNQAPKIAQMADINVQNVSPTTISLTGFDDGDAHSNQTLTFSAISSNTDILPNPVIEYTEGDFTANMILSPIAEQTGAVVVTVTLQDDGETIAGGADTETMAFTINVFDGINNPPVMNELIDISILQDDPEQTIPLRGISSGDEGSSQNLTITAISSNTGLITDPLITYTQGSKNGNLSFTPETGQTGTSIISVTVADDGGTVDNNGNEETVYTFEVEVRVRPILGWEDEFNDGILGTQWPAVWGDPGEDTHLCTEQDGAMKIQVDKTRTNNKWAGLWFQIPNELDMSDNAYISITMKTDEAPKDMHIFLWDAYDHYNTSKTVKYTVTGDFIEYFFDYSDPSYQLQGDGTVVDISRIKALLINFDPGGASPLYQGSFYFDDFRVGDKAHRAVIAPTVTFDEVPDFSIVKDASEQSITLVNISDGGDGSNDVSITASSDNTSLIPDPLVESVSGNQAELKYTPVAGQTGSATITLNAAAAGSTALNRTFQITVSALDAASATDITIDLATTFQEIDGFGAFMGSGGTAPDTIITLAEDIGMSMARFGLIGGGFEEVNDNSDPYILNLDGFNPDALSISNMKRIAPFVDKFILTVWSPAGWMKYNKWEGGVENYASDNKLDPRYYEEYAEEIIAVLKIVKRETGKDIYGLGLQNEPQFNEPYPSCQVNPEEYRDIIKVVGPRLEAEGYGDVKLFWAEALPAQNSIDDYIDAVKDDPLAETYADIVAIHNYDADGASVGGAGCGTWGNIYDWAQAGNYQYKTWMTETSGHADDWDGAMTLAGNIFNALECGNSSAWVFWSFSVSEGSSEFGLVVSNRPSSRYYISKQYYKFIRPGAVRVDVSTESIPAIAFKNDVEKTISVVLFNNTDQTQTIEIKGAGLPSQWEVHTTSNHRNCEQQSDLGPEGLIILPPSSLTTLVGDNLNPSPAIDDIADQYIKENAGSQDISLSGVSDGESLTQQLTFVATSDNTALIADPVVTYNQGESTATLSYTPETDQFGEAEITLTIKDDGEPIGTAIKKFIIYVEEESATNEIDMGHLNIYPNPAREMLYITFEPGAFNLLFINDISGRMTQMISLQSGEDRIELDVSAYESGIYFITCANDASSERAKFIVE
jgi:O-glycosyl hydrolase